MAIDLVAMGKAAKDASRKLATLSTNQKNEALLVIADELESQSQMVLAQNALDINDGRGKGLSEAILDRLLLTDGRIANLAAQVKQVETEVAKIEKQIAGRRDEARESMAEMMNRVSKSSKLVAEYTSRIGALESERKALAYRIGSFLSANFRSSSPTLRPILRKHRNLLGKIDNLRQSIHYHRVLAGRSHGD